MKFTGIRLYGLTQVDFPLVNLSASSPYILKEVEGLGPPEINVSIANVMNMDGHYQGRQIQYREPVLTVGLNPNYKTNVLVPDLRSELYGLLSGSVNDEISLVIMYENDEIMSTTGYVKKMEVVPFTESPEVQITISCTQSYFEALDVLYVEMQSNQLWQAISNVGTVETGLVAKFLFTHDCNQFIVKDHRFKTMKLIFDFLVGDYLTIDTRPGSKSIIVIREGSEGNIIYALTMASEWLSVYGGENNLQITEPVAEWIELYYKPKYWGV